MSQGCSGSLQRAPVGSEKEAMSESPKEGPHQDRDKSLCKAELGGWGEWGVGVSLLGSRVSETWVQIQTLSLSHMTLSKSLSLGAFVLLL